MTQQLERHPFFQDAIAAFGYLDAQELGFTIIESFDAAQEQLPLLKPVTGIRPMVSRLAIHKVGGFAGSDGIIDLAFPRDMAIQQILEQVPEVIRHETAHVAHNQHSPGFLTDAGRLFLFAAAISEGIADHAVEELYEFTDTQDWDVDYKDESTTEIRGIVSELLRSPPRNQEKIYYEFLFGETDFPLDGYQVGYYLVAAIAHSQKLNLKQLMRLPLPEYVDFVEGELL